MRHVRVNEKTNKGLEGQRKKNKGSEKAWRVGRNDSEWWVSSVPEALPPPGTKDVGGGITTISFPSWRSDDAMGDEGCDATSNAPPSPCPTNAEGVEDNTSTSALSSRPYKGTTSTARSTTSSSL